MKNMGDFRKEFIGIALPVALQSLLQSSFSVVDQIMVGQLGENSIAGIGLAGKFSSLYSVLLSAIAAVAGIMLAQYVGKKDKLEVARSFYLNLFLSLGLAVLFTAICVFVPKPVMGMYTTDTATRDCASVYLMIIAAGYIVRAGSILLSTLLRCMGCAKIPLYATLFNTVFDTVFSYVLIFGKFGFPKMDVAGAALATVIAQIIEFAIILILFLKNYRKEHWHLPFTVKMTKERWKVFGGILAPILVCEFFWSLGENVYASIYGHIGTDSCAAMTLIAPMVTLFMGLMGGVAQAAGILCGKTLGAKQYEQAYDNAKKMIWYGVVGSLVLSILLMTFGRYYVGIFKVSESVRNNAYYLVLVFALIAPVKVQNMILGGGIIRSGGKTKYVMVIDLIGTWGIGVPIGLIAAFVFDLPIVPVYFLLSLEEVIRMLISLQVFRKKKWMMNI